MMLLFLACRKVRHIIAKLMPGSRDKISAGPSALYEQPREKHCGPSMDKTDEELLEAYLKGQSEALAVLVERYRRMLYGFILDMTGAREDADEVFQEVWLRVMRKARLYRKRNFRGWLMRLTHNLLIDRARTRRSTVSLDAMDQELHTFASARQ